jgi:hypothetical protein
MAVNEDIVAARNCGVVRCGLSSQPGPTVSELAREFGLRDDAACYRQTDEPTARRVVHGILHKDMAYNSEIMSEARASELTALFFEQFGDGAKLFTNGTFHEERRQLSPTVWSGPSWDPVTEATFDTGVLIIGPRISGCLWIEDED